MPSPIKLTAEEASRIPASAWQLVEETEDFIRREARITLPNGVSATVLETIPKGADELLLANAEMRKENSERRYTAGMGSDKGGNMPMVHTGSIPLNIYFRDIAPHASKGDKDHLRWWLRQPENEAFRVRDKGLRR